LLYWLTDHEEQFHTYVEELDQVLSNGSFLIFLGKYFLPKNNHCY
jgi:hypothetical protein